MIRIETVDYHCILMNETDINEAEGNGSESYLNENRIFFAIISNQSRQS